MKTRTPQEVGTRTPQVVGTRTLQEAGARTTQETAVRTPQEAVAGVRVARKVSNSNGLLNLPPSAKGDYSFRSAFRFN